MKKLSKKVAKKISFSKLSKPQKRIAIARDVLEQIKSQKYFAKTGSYIHININDINLYQSGKDIKENFDKIKYCTVCAMGACLMSATKFANKLKFIDIGSDIHSLRNDRTKELFASIFSPEQLLLIERAFEGDTGGSTVGCDIFNLEEGDFKNEIEKCEVFHNKYYGDSQERMIEIMKNLIKNKGTFKP